MKKTLLIGSALVIGFAGYSQSNANKVVNLKYTKGTIVGRKKVITEGPAANVNWQRTVLPNKTTSGSCLTKTHLTSSWNANGVGGGADCVQQNCLAYNKDLNALMWYQRASKDWSLIVNSGAEQATIITNVNPNVAGTYSTNVLDSVIAEGDNVAATTIGGRFPGGSWLNALGNTNYHNAYACGTGPYNAGSNWLGSIYVAKPLWSTSAKNHTMPTNDSQYVAAPGFMGPMCDNTAFTGAPNCDMQQHGNAVWSTGSYLDPGVTNTNGNAIRNGFILKGTDNTAHDTVKWTIDSTSLFYNFYKGAALGRLVAGAPRLAFGPDGQHGYAVYIGRSATTYSNSADSCMTPIVFQTTNGGTNWTQVLAGYDWACHHPEVTQGLGKGTFSVQASDMYSFSAGFNGVDVVVDANNALHLVCTVEEPYRGDLSAAGHVYSFDSLQFSYTYNWDNINYHPIIWDFMTDGTSWKTMMVDSLLSANCGEVATSDTTANYSAWSSTSPDFLDVGAHLTVSRTVDGTKVFYGWADSPQGINTWVHNTNPDLMLRAYDVNTKMMTPAPSIAASAAGGSSDMFNLGYMFFPYIADFCYYDTTQSSWVVPAVYTTGRSSSTKAPGFTLYDGTNTVDYWYTNCGTFSQSDFNVPAAIYTATSATVCGSSSVGIEKYNNNAFASSIENYPNPFNSTTTIAITLTENKPVSIKVYNTMGALVFTKTIDGTAGTNNVTFDGGQVSSGVYYYTVTAGAEQATKKMIIQK